ncbi:triacylglycerol lipase [Cellulomonas sp. URHD0024]|uniref:esterase/lipase family protein n=1 Tax=Cellulomonas sp. URHD0024 TaxID=1302620 RepID=UPI000481B535|nr:alpha/beta fold hydrolase [Cellulomonas sp. URHD0024]
MPDADVFPTPGAVRHLWWRVRDYASVLRWQLASSRGWDAYLAPQALVGPPVVLVPGVWEPWQFLRPVAEVLYAHGVRVHTVPALGYNRRPVADAAQVLARYLEEHDLREVVLVAHSKGGLIGKLAMLEHDADGRISSMVAVNTPFSGSTYARWIPLRSVRAFIPSDETIVALAAEVEVNHRITSAHAFWDPHIPGGSHLDGAHEVVLATPGHFRPLADPQLRAILLDRLTA